MIQFLVSLLLTSVTFPQQNLVDWNASRKLTWDDFKAVPVPGSSNAALTSSSINIEFGYDENGLQYSIKCRFDKNRSWVKVKNTIVLEHEQGHFDIAEIHARKLNKALRKYAFNSKTVSDDVNKIYDTLMEAHNAYQNQYDQETDFSRNKEKQAAWLKKVADELKDLAPYQDYKKT